jgi:hypothetical protein
LQAAHCELLSNPSMPPSKISRERLQTDELGLAICRL